MADDADVAQFREYLVQKAHDPLSGMTPGERGLYCTLVVPTAEQAAMAEETREALVSSTTTACVAAANAARAEVLAALLSDTMPGVIERQINVHEGGEAMVDEIARYIADYVVRVCPEYTLHTDPSAPIAPIVPRQQRPSTPTRTEDDA